MSSGLKSSDTKRRPSILHKGSKEVDNRVGSGTLDGMGLELKRRFSLRDAVRRIFSGNQEKACSNIPQVSMALEGHHSLNISHRVVLCTNGHVRKTANPNSCK